MSKTTTRVLFSAAALIAAFSAVPSAPAAQVLFRDTFDRPDSAVFGPNSGPEGSGTWNKTLQSLGPATAGTFNIAGGRAVATHHDNDALYQIIQNTSAFAAPYPVSAKLSDAWYGISWYINMQSTYTIPNGIGAAAGGMGIVLGSTVGAFGSTNGYLLYFGNSGAADPPHLASFAPAALPVDIVSTAGFPAPFDTAGDVTDWFSYRVDYIQAGNVWKLWARKDGASPVDPTLATGYTLLGSGVDSTYTSTPLPLSGIIGSYRTSGFTTSFDNFTVSIVPEPSSFVLVGLGLIGLIGLARRKAA